MSESTTKLYAERDIEQLDDAGNYYLAHASAMTTEGLYSKSAIAAELAFRDWQIDKLKTENAKLMASLKQKES